MRTLITQQGDSYYWSVVPPICSQTELNYGKADSYEDAEKAIERYCKADVAKQTRRFQSSMVPCYSPTRLWISP